MKRMNSPFANFEVRGARENNLKNILLDIPRRQITVFSGVSTIRFSRKQARLAGRFPRNTAPVRGHLAGLQKLLQDESETT